MLDGGGPVIRVWFTDFWEGWVPSNNFFVHLLASGPELAGIHLDPVTPQLLFFSVFHRAGQPGHLAYNPLWKQGKCVKVFYTGENVRADFSQCDIALDFERLSQVPPKKLHLRLPLWLLYIDHFGVPPCPGQSPQYLVPYAQLFAPRANIRSLMAGFVAKNPAGPRLTFVRLFQKQCGEQSVACPGPLANNAPPIGPGERAKLEFLERCNISIAFENSSHPGYCTEKLFHALAAKTLPIYWGDPLADKDFNPDAFIHLQRDAQSLETMTLTGFKADVLERFFKIGLKNGVMCCPAIDKVNARMWTREQEVKHLHFRMLELRAMLLQAVGLCQTRSVCWNPQCPCCTSNTASTPAPAAPAPAATPTP